MTYTKYVTICPSTGYISPIYPTAEAAEECARQNAEHSDNRYYVSEVYMHYEKEPVIVKFNVEPTRYSQF